MADLTDMDLVFNYPDPDLFPGVPGDVLVHEGFRDEHNKTAAIILAEVNRLLSVYRTTNVIVVCPYSSEEDNSEAINHHAYILDRSLTRRGARGT
jgi:hypothetical protein